MKTRRETSQELRKQAAWDNLGWERRWPISATVCASVEGLPRNTVSAWLTRSGRTIATKEKTLDDLFLHTLKDLYYAEKQILKALPKMAKNAESEELKAAVETHREQTQGRSSASSRSSNSWASLRAAVPCEAINGIIEESKEIMEDFADSPALDAGILSSAQAVEHYGITRYGTLKTWAQQLGLSGAVTLFDQTLQEDKETDELLTRLAQACVNAEAA
jgi:ferritin-like metal-binding protein YciE